MPNSGYFDVIFASSGDLTAVPDAIQVSGSISYTQGWGPYYSQDPTVDPSTALLIDRAQTNQLFNDVTTAIQAYQQFGTPPFITSSQNGGTPFSYPQYARVSYNAGGGVATYQPLKPANTDLPSVASSWQIDEQTTNPPQGDHKNLKGLWGSISTASFSADSIVVTNSSGLSQLITAFSKSLNTAVSGIGGLSTGTLTDEAWYAVYAALDLTSGTQGIFFDPSFTAPTLPSGYTYWALIGSIRTDGSSNLVGFIQYDRDVQWVTGKNLANQPVLISGSIGNTTTPSWAPADVTAATPPNASKIKVTLYGLFAGPECMAAPNNSYGAYAVSNAANAPPLMIANSSGSSTGNAVAAEFVLESTNVYYASSGGSGSGLICRGYTMNL